MLPNAGDEFRQFRVREKVGEGGMGVVFRAHDARLGRDVALKFLTQLGRPDAERTNRLEREARSLAALNHPNVVTIHDFDFVEGIPFLVLEWVDGRTLDDPAFPRPLPLTDFFRIAGAVADALGAAHERGIIHRDLKPANIKLTADGQVKILDFGLAKALTDDVAHADVSTSPPLSMAATRAGIILGTAAYMSPEQARGKPVDRRTDIWSFGCVLYECLTGTQAFAGETVSDTIAMILQGSADWSKLPASTPEKLRLLITRCLERDARDAPDLGLAIAHGVEALAHAIELSYSLRLAEVDVSGELAHDEDVEPGDHLRLERRRRGELRMHARRAQVGEQPERLAQPKNRLLGALGALKLVVARVAHRAEQHRTGLLGNTQCGCGKRVARGLVACAPDRRSFHLQRQLERLQHPHSLRNDLRPDAVTGQNGDLHPRSTRDTGLCVALRTRGSCPPGAA